MYAICANRSSTLLPERRAPPSAAPVQASSGVHLRFDSPLRGFKSFPDRVEVRLEPGVAVVVGPNGSGSSNVARPGRLGRGFAGARRVRRGSPRTSSSPVPPARAPAKLVLGRRLRQPGRRQRPVSEVSVARRLTRGGQGQYLHKPGPGPAHRPRRAARRPRARRRDASVISQGKVEQIPGSKPGDRRAGQAAGLEHFKQRRHHARRLSPGRRSR